MTSGQNEATNIVLTILNPRFGDMVDLVGEAQASVLASTQFHFFLTSHAGGLAISKIDFSITAIGAPTVSTVPGPIVGAGLPGLILAAAAFSAGGDGGRRSPEFPAQFRTRRLRQPAIAE